MEPSKGAADARTPLLSDQTTEPSIALEVEDSGGRADRKQEHNYRSVSPASNADSPRDHPPPSSLHALGQLASILTTPMKNLRRMSQRFAISGRDSPGAIPSDRPSIPRANSIRPMTIPLPHPEEDEDSTTQGPFNSPEPNLPIDREDSRLDFEEGEEPKNRWDTMKMRARYYIPILRWLPEYDRPTFLSDLSAGLTMGVFLIPVAVAYASIANRTPIAGLYTAYFPMVFYTFFGSSRQLSLGPEAIVATLTGSFLENLVGENGTPDDYDTYALILAFLVGFFLLLAGLFRLGFIESILTHSVVAGLIIAVCLEVMTSQSRTMLGIPCDDGCDPEDSTFVLFGFILSHLHRAHWPTILISLCAVSFLWGMKYVQKRFSNYRVVEYLPTTLILVIFSILISWSAKFADAGVVVMGSQTGGFQAPKGPSITMDRLNKCIGPAFTIGILLFVESFVVAKTYATKHNYPISANRELVALGMSNMLASFFGAFSAGGSLARSKINDQLGAKTPMAGFIASCVLLIAISAILPLFADLPKATIAAIVFVAVSSLIDAHEILYLIRIRAWIDLCLFVGMVVLTLALGIDNSIIFAFVACIALLVKNVAVVDPKLAVLGRLKTGRFVDASEYTDAEPVEGMLFLRLQGPLHFVNIARIRDLFRRIEWFGDISHHPSEDPSNWELKPGTWIVIDMETVPSFDTSAITVFSEIVEQLMSRKMGVYLVGVHTKIALLLHRCGLAEKLGADKIFVDRYLVDIGEKLISMRTQE